MTANSIPAELDRLAALEQVLGGVRRAGKLAQEIGLRGGHPHVDAGLARDRRDAAQVVDVAVRDEHAGRLPAAAGELRPDEVRLVAGVDHGSLRSPFSRHEVAVRLVGAEGELDDLEAGRPAHAAGPPCFFWYRRQTKFSTIQPIDQKSTNITAVLASLMPGLMALDVNVMTR